MNKPDEKLFEEVRSDDVVAVKVAIEFGAEANTKNRDGNTPLDIALKNVYTEMDELIKAAMHKPKTKSVKSGNFKITIEEVK